MVEQRSDSLASRSERAAAAALSTDAVAFDDQGSVVEEAPLRIAGVVAGAAAIVGVASTAELFGWLVPVVGAPVSAILIGAALRCALAPDAAAQRAISLVSRYVLQMAIVALGATLSLGEVVRVGRASLPVMLATLLGALAMSVIVGRTLGVHERLRTLIGVGTAICGASAIGAVSGVIAATETEIAYAISTIFVFNLASVLLYPAIGHLLELGQWPFGLWAGTAINDTSSVVAAAYSYGDAAGDYAVVVKLSRATMIVPVALALMGSRLLSTRGRSPLSIGRLVPWFLVWFVLAAGLGSAGFISPGVRHALARVGVILITVALGAVGLSTRFAAIRRAGLRPLLLGGVLWVVVGVTGLAMQFMPWSDLTP